MSFLLALASAYFVGGVPTAYVAGRLSRGIDLRQYGSGNVGASNAGQHLGKAYFLLVAAFDALVKGAGVVVLTRTLGLGLEAQAGAGLAAAIGHNWSPYLRFTGGRGLAVIGGGLLVLSWPLVAGGLGMALLGGKVFHNYGLWFGVALLLLPLGAALLGEPAAVLGFTLGGLAVTAVKRLLSNPGTSDPGVSWRRKALPRLLFDRDTWEREEWVQRRPLDSSEER